MNKININGLKKQEGITLIALVITIVVLIIIAGISITSGKQSIKSSKEDVLLSELGMVQNAVLQRKTKIDLTNESYPGEKISDVGINLDEVISDINSERNSDEESITRKDSSDENYYFLSTSNDGLKDLGIKNSENEYIVNYQTGEVINYSMKVTGQGKPLYIYARESD